MEWTPTLRKTTLRLALFLTLLCCLVSFGLMAQTPCNKMITGRGAVVTEVQGGTLCVNCTGMSNSRAVTDANTENYASFNSAGIAGGSGISVADTLNTFAAGWKAGYIVSFDNTSVSASLLSNISLSTYLDGQLRETRNTGTGLNVTLLGNATGKLHLSFTTTQSFDEVRFVFGNGIGSVSNFRIYSALAFDPACGLSDGNTICYDQIAGPSTELTYNGGLANALVTFTNEGNVTDGDRNSFATLTLPAGVALLSTPPYVGVREREIVHPAGRKAGFVIGYNASLLTANVLNALSIQTYLHGQFQEAANFSNGTGLLNLSALSTAGVDRKELSFFTTLPFDEVRLVVSQSASVNVGSVNIYYAFESGAGCADPNTELLSSQPAPDNGAINAGRTGSFGTLCINQSLTGTANVVNTSTADYATFVPATLSVGCGASISVQNSGADYPAGTFAGFVISRQGSLVDLNLLDAITVNVYKDGGATAVASSSGAALLNLGALNDDDSLTTIGFKPNTAFDEVQIVFNSGLIATNLAGSYHIYYAFVQKDSDSDSVPDPIDICSGNDALDWDGDGLPNDCDGCNALNAKSVYADTDGDGVKDACDADSDDDGIADVVEDRNADGNPTGDDADGDGIANYLDLDSDDDGLTDLDESGITGTAITLLDANNNNVIDASATRGANGMANLVESADTLISGNNYQLGDKDEDGAPDFVDLDSDNDGINDITEGFPGLIADADGNGMVDGGDSDRDGIANAADGDPTRGSANLAGPADADGDGVANFRDLDSDNDLRSDLVENGQPGFTDNDHNGVADGADSDGDGILNPLDGNNGTFGDANQNAPVDTDSDGLPDYLDPDSNNNGVKDIADNGNGWQDLDGDGDVDNPIDPDNDGIPNNHGDDLDPGNFGGLAPASLLTVKVLLQGALVGAADTLMRDDLRQAGIIPTGQPYNSTLSGRFATYGGGGSESTTTAILATNANTNDAVVDWVLLEFRKSGTPAVVTKTLAAFVQRDGDVVGSDNRKLGVLLDTGNYHIAIKHRNHLGVMTAAPVVSSGQPAAADFRNSSLAVYGTNALKLMSSGKRALFGGDVNADGQVYYTAPGNDRDALLNLLSGNQFGYGTNYSNGDLNMDAQTYMTAPGNDRDWLLSEPLSGNEFEYRQEQLPQ